MKAPDLARELRVSPKRLRDWLRETYPRPEADKGSRWLLDPSVVAAARSHFAAKRP